MSHAMTFVSFAIFIFPMHLDVHFVIGCLEEAIAADIAKLPHFSQLSAFSRRVI